MSTTETLLMVGQGAQGQNPWTMPLFMLAMVFVMYFFLMRPQMKKAKEQKAFSNNTNVGDMIVTTAGIHGKIVKTNDDGTISVEVDRNTILKMDKSSISMELTNALRKRMDAGAKA